MWNSYKISKKEFDKINEFISDGFFLNEEDFARESIREKLKSMEAITIMQKQLLPKKQGSLKEIHSHLKKIRKIDGLVTIY